jgi:hypothetical protein
MSNTRSTFSIYGFVIDIPSFIVAMSIVGLISLVSSVFLLSPQVGNCSQLEIESPELSCSLVNSTEGSCNIGNCYCISSKSSTTFYLEGPSQCLDPPTISPNKWKSIFGSILVFLTAICLTIAIALSIVCACSATIKYLNIHHDDELLEENIPINYDPPKKYINELPTRVL